MMTRKNVFGYIQAIKAVMIRSGYGVIMRDYREDQDEEENWVGSETLMVNPPESLGAFYETYLVHAPDSTVFHVNPVIAAQLIIDEVVAIVGLE